MSYYGKKPPKPEGHYKWVEIWFGCMDGKPVEEAVERVRKAAEGVETPVIYQNYVFGWMLMTADEIAAARKRQAGVAKANAARREKQRQKELAELRRLAEKHGVALGEGT